MNDKNELPDELGQDDIDIEKILSEADRPHKDRVGEFRQMMGQAEKRRRRNRVLNILLIIFAAIFLVSGYFLLRYYMASRENKKLVSSLKEMIDTEDEPSDDPDSTPSTEKASPADPGTKATEKPSKHESQFTMVNDRLVLKKFKNLYEKNSDFIGWLSAEGTSIDYPVMYTPQNEEKYLRKNFDGDYALAGTLFLAADSDPVRPSTNLIIYGHNMKDGSMFSDLLKYKDQTFYEEHKYIRFDTIYGTGYYEIIAAFQGQILNVGEEGFRYYTFFNADNSEEFDDYVRNVTSLSSISAAASAEFGDELLTLSTCDNSGADQGKRFVVVAKKTGK